MLLNSQLQRSLFQTCINLSHDSRLVPELREIAEISIGNLSTGERRQSGFYAASRSTSGSRRAFASAALASAIPLLPRSRVLKFSFLFVPDDVCGAISMRRNCLVMVPFLSQGGTVEFASLS